MAKKLDAGLKAMVYPMLVSSPTNQVFPILMNQQIAFLEQSFNFEHWVNVDADHTAIRLVTSWATRLEAVDAFLSAVRP